MDSVSQSCEEFLLREIFRVSREHAQRPGGSLAFGEASDRFNEDAQPAATRGIFWNTLIALAFTCKGRLYFIKAIHPGVQDGVSTVYPVS